jgi:hypothetical protein
MPSMQIMTDELNQAAQDWMAVNRPERRGQCDFGTMADFASDRLDAQRKEIASKLCEWCAAGKPIAEPMYGRTHERWHVPFPETPTDTQRVRCSAEKVWELADAIEGGRDGQ